MRDFKEARLIDITIGNGTYGIAAPAVPKDNNKYTYLRITDINDDGSLNFSDLKSVDDPKANKYLLKPNDIVFARTGNSTGRSYFYDGSAGELVYAGFLIKFSLDSHKVNPKILKYYTHSKDYYDWVASFDSGATRGNINAKTFAEMPITLPPRNIQDKIVAILSALDEKIETNRKINKRLEELAQAIFKSWFIDNAVYENSTIADFFLPIRGKSLLTSDAKLGEVPVVAGGLTPATYHNKSNTKAPVITISASGANAGFVNIWGCPVWSSDSSFIDNSITPYVYFWYSLLKYYQKIIYHFQTGCAQPHIYPKHIGNINIPCIEVRKMEIFEKVVTPLFEKLFENKKECAQLAELRDTLLPKLMSGELIPV